MLIIFECCSGTARNWYDMTIDKRNCCVFMRFNLTVKIKDSWMCGSIWVMNEISRENSTMNEAFLKLYQQTPESNEAYEQQN